MYAFDCSVFVLCDSKISIVVQLVLFACDMSVYAVILLAVKICIIYLHIPNKHSLSTSSDFYCTF